jgi:hypothetical protein
VAGEGIGRDIGIGRRVFDQPDGRHRLRRGRSNGHKLMTRLFRKGCGEIAKLRRKIVVDK